MSKKDIDMLKNILELKEYQEPLFEFWSELRHLSWEEKLEIATLVNKRMKIDKDSSKSKQTGNNSTH